MEDFFSGKYDKMTIKEFRERKPGSVEPLGMIEENKTLNRLFKLQHKRSLEADKLWQKATGNTHVFPDLGVLLEWLMDQRKIMLTALKEMSAELKLSNDQGDLEIDGRHMNILAVWDEIDNLIKQEKK